LPNFGLHFVALLPGLFPVTKLHGRAEMQARAQRESIETGFRSASSVMARLAGLSWYLKAPVSPPDRTRQSCGRDSAADVLAAFPSLKPEDVQAAIAFAGASAEEDLPVAAVPDIRS
jgi:hypothetical protein